jgi:two-component system heavy metal sensor histidine kinase CusS
MFDLRAEVMKVFEFFEAWAEERNITLKFNGMPCLVEGDPQMFRRAINNLLSNALRYTPEGQAITVSIREQESFFDLVIENPGNRSLKNIYQGCLTVFIGWIHPDNERRRQRHRPCDCEVNRGSTSRKSAGGIRRTLHAFYLIRAQTGENDPGNPMLKIKM